MAAGETPAALVTGASRRIGAAIARDLAAHGWRVAIHHNQSADLAQALAGEIRESGGEAICLAGDLVSTGGPQALFAEARAALGPIHLLVNNASIFRPDTAASPDPQLWDKHFAIHTRAPSLLGAALAAQTELNRGLIVNIIDQRVWRLNPNFYSYTLSKAALWTATQTQAQAFAPRIRVNAIGPGPTLANERQSAEDFNRQVAGLPLQRGPELDEFGATIRYLWQAHSVTGQMIALDGGQHLAWQTPDIAGIAE